MRKFSLSLILLFSFLSLQAQSLKAFEQNGKWGFTDQYGRTKVKPTFDEVGTVPDRESGLWPVKKDDKWGFINKNGKLTVPVQFDEVGNYFDYLSGLCAVKLDGKWGYMNRKGVVVVPIEFDEIGESFDRESGLCPVKKDNKWGYLSRSGQLSIPIKYDFVTPFSNERACVKNGELFFSISPSGKINFSYPCDSLAIFGTDHYLIKKDRQYGVLDSSGNAYVELIYDDIRRGWEESFIIKKDGLWGVFKDGEFDFENPEKIIYFQPDKKAYFPGCNLDELDETEAKICSDKKLLNYIYGNIKYPAEARKNGVEGMIVVSFVIDENGQIQNPKVIRDIGAGVGEEGLRVVKGMPNWIPGEVDGKVVKVGFNLPIKFKLQ